MKKIIFTSLAILLVSFIFVSNTSAANLSDKQKNIIIDSCNTTQTTLQRIGDSDITARINRGRNYDQILKLFYAMNTRVASNNIAEPRLAELTKDFENNLNNFRNDYNKYNEQLKLTYETNCKTKVDAFYDNLNNSRNSRAKIRSDINELNKIIKQYQKVVKGLVK